jgi:hypothetical protein
MKKPLLSSISIVDAANLEGTLEALDQFVVTQNLAVLDEATIVLMTPRPYR